MFEAVQRGELTPDHIVLLHPDDFNTLRTFVQREGLDPSFAVRATINGARIISDASHPRGLATILNGRTRPELIRHYGLTDVYRSAREASAPSPPEPKSLWERLDEDE
jgi:hypothetical protein